MLQNFPFYAPIMLYCAELCFIMLHKFIKLLTVPEDIPVPLTI